MHCCLWCCPAATQLYGNPLEYLPELAPAVSLRSLSLANVRILADVAYSRSGQCDRVTGGLMQLWEQLGGRGWIAALGGRRRLGGVVGAVASTCTLPGMLAVVQTHNIWLAHVHKLLIPSEGMLLWHQPV